MLPDRVTPVRVLAVDDEMFNLDLIEFAFAEDDDVEVVRAEDGRRALDLLAIEDIDVVLLDLAMPVLDGFGTLAAMQDDARLRTLPVIVVTANAEEKHRALALGASDFLAKPVDVDELTLRTRNHARMKAYQDYLGRLNEVLEEQVAQRTAELREALDLARRAEQEVAYRLGRAAEFRDMETGSHIRRMSLYAARLAELHGLPRDQVELIQRAAPLHDIGKVGIPDAVLLKPGQLDPDEYAIMQRHVDMGASMLEDTDAYPLLAAGRIIALQHHEKFDGSGYPAGLAGEQIHIFGRLVAVADVFDALTSRRVYKPAFALDQALAIMTEGRGTHFDPAIVDLLMANLDDFLAIRAEHADAADELPRILEMT